MMTTSLNTKKLCIIYFLFLIMFFIALSGQKTLMNGVARWILEQKPENSARFHIHSIQNQFWIEILNQIAIQVSW